MLKSYSSLPGFSLAQWKVDNAMREDESLDPVKQIELLSDLGVTPYLKYTECQAINATSSTGNMSHTSFLLKHEYKLILIRSIYWECLIIIHIIRVWHVPIRVKHVYFVSIVCTLPPSVAYYQWCYKVETMWIIVCINQTWMATLFILLQNVDCLWTSHRHNVLYPTRVLVCRAVYCLEFYNGICSTKWTMTDATIC